MIVSQAIRRRFRFFAASSIAVMAALLSCFALESGASAADFSPPGRAPHYASSRQMVEKYASTNKTFAPSMEYVVSTLDGRQPDGLPSGVTPADIAHAMLVVFPKSSPLLDQPIFFYGQVFDEDNAPVAGARVHFEWRGFFIHGKRFADILTDRAGMFSLTNQLGQQLNVSVDKAGYYVSDRNRGAGFFRYASGEAFKPDPGHPVQYFLHKRGVGTSSLLTSQNGVREGFSINAPLNGTPVKFDLLQHKTGEGPLEIRQIMPGPENWKTTTNWSFSATILDGGFVEVNEEFPFHPPPLGYQPTVKFNFEKGGTNWATNLRKNYYIRFGNPPLYGRIRMEASVWSSSPLIVYVINPDGERNLEPKNE